MSNLSLITEGKGGEFLKNYLFREFPSEFQDYILECVNDPFFFKKKGYMYPSHRNLIKLIVSEGFKFENKTFDFNSISLIIEENIRFGDTHLTYTAFLDFLRLLGIPSSTLSKIDTSTLYNMIYSAIRTKISEGFPVIHTALLPLQSVALTKKDSFDKEDVANNFKVVDYISFTKDSPLNIISILAAFVSLDSFKKGRYNIYYVTNVHKSSRDLEIGFTLLDDGFTVREEFTFKAVLKMRISLVNKSFSMSCGYINENSLNTLWFPVIYDIDSLPNFAAKSFEYALGRSYKKLEYYRDTVVSYLEESVSSIDSIKNHSIWEYLCRSSVYKGIIVSLDKIMERYEDLDKFDLLMSEFDLLNIILNTAQSYSYKYRHSVEECVGKFILENG